MDRIAARILMWAIVMTVSAEHVCHASSENGSAIDPGVSKTQHVAANGSYQTSYEIFVPPAPGAPRISLVYNSAAIGGVAGIGWDLSVGWPAIISRDTRFGTPSWKLDSDWIWDGRPLVVTPASLTLCQQTGECEYRLAPDDLTTIKIKLRPTINTDIPTAEVFLPSGTKLTYQPVIYDGLIYPNAPTGAATNIFAFLLSTAIDSNGYSTCFKYKHFGDSKRGKVAVLDEIAYGLSPSYGDCPQILSNISRHRIEFTHNDLHDDGFFSQWSMRIGAPARFSNLLKQITIYALGTEQFRIALQHEGQSSETRRPRLIKIEEQIHSAGNQIQRRVVRVFNYGDRSLHYETEKVIDLGPLGSFPSSIAGSVSRPIRRPQLFNNPNGVFQLGRDQIDDAAPSTSAGTEEWGWLDLNGDGLLDFHWGRETGHDPSGVLWSTFEPGGSSPISSRPAQQLVRISEGVKDDPNRSELVTTPMHIDTRAPVLEQSYQTATSSTPGFTPWIWPEGQGLTRTGMPLSVSAPEIQNPAPICPPVLGQDSRVWPVFPDGTLGGSQGSIGETVSAFAPTAQDQGIIFNEIVYRLVPSIRNAYQPRYSFSSSLSGWFDINGDGIPEFIVTPGWIERFSLTNPLCLGFARESHPAAQLAGVDSDWHAASFPVQTPISVHGLNLRPIPGPNGPIGLPLDYHISTGSQEGFGFTLPFGSLFSAAASAAMGGPSAFAFAIPSLIGESFSPRSQAGASISVPSPSITGVLHGSASFVKEPSSGSLYSFATSVLKVNFDFTLLSTTTRNRSETRAQLLDINADGLLDYVMYNSGTEIPGASKGSLITFLNSSSGFSNPIEINQGLDYTASLPDLSKLKTAVDNAKTEAAVVAGLSKACDGARKSPDPGSAVTAAVICSALQGAIFKIASTGGAVIEAVERFINSTTDAIPAERFHLQEVALLRDALNATALLGDPVSLNAGAQALEVAIRMLDRTVRQLAYRSRLNVISRGFSEIDGALIGESARGFAVQTRGFVDLNGDALPDYVITSDRESFCPIGQWEVFWGIGTSSIVTKRAFDSKSECITVPPVPADVSANGFATLPLNVERVLRAPTVDAHVVDTLSHTYITLQDFNHDGRPDIIMAGEGSTVWDPDASSRTWLVFLNTGSGFESTAGIKIGSPQTARSDIKSTLGISTGLKVPYPGIRTNHTDGSIGFARDRSDTVAGFLDINGDGVNEIATRVQIVSSSSPNRDGLLVWTRASTGPQDTLIEDRDPIAGQRSIIEYKPASYFQWSSAKPDGMPPQGGHHELGGSSGHLVRSVTSEPLMGRNEQRTRIGFQYKASFFDSKKRMSAGFAIRSTESLDPITGSSIGPSILTIQRNAQRPDGVNSITHQREVIQKTGAPVYETLISSVEHPTILAIPGGVNSVFSAPARYLTVEYPERLKLGAVFDVGFDGRDPFADRAASIRPVSTLFPPLLPMAATGGAARFTGLATNAVQYVSPHLASTTSGHVQELTVEAWIKSTASPSDRTIVEQIGAYRLSVVRVGGEERAQVEVAGTRLTSSNSIPPDRWMHVVVTFGSGIVKLFLNGVSAGSASVSTIPIASGDLIIGCSKISVGMTKCFEGEIGELRIYPEVWPHGPRLTDTEHEFQLNSSRHDFGQHTKVMERHDLAHSDDNVVTEFTYANSVGNQNVLGVVSSLAHRVLGADGSTSGNYLDYVEHYFDNLSVGLLTKGNLTSTVKYDGPTDVTSKPTNLNVLASIRYHNSDCPGRPTVSVDPEGFETHTSWDSTCSFTLSTTNALGHVIVNRYYGINAYSYPKVTGPYGTYELTGRFGQIAEEIDINGTATQFAYDKWGRQVLKRSSLDRKDRPSLHIEYRDAQCDGDPFCSNPIASQLISPSRITTYSWDDQLDRCKTSHGHFVSCASSDAVEISGDGAIGSYRVTHSFGDGQVHAQTIQNGRPDWTISGTRDFDLLGRVIRVYKPRHLSEVLSGTTNTCPPAGSWCDSTHLTGDPLRSNVVTHQTAYDERGRALRVYGPGVPKCTLDPSTLDANRQPICDAQVPPTDKGHITRIEYPYPGTVRTIDALNISSLTHFDTRGLPTVVEEYEHTSTSPYSTVRKTYDRLRRQVETTDHKSNVSKISYDALGRVTFSDDQNIGKKAFSYDKRGLLTRQVVATGDITKHTYDQLGRLNYSEYRRSTKGNNLEIDECLAPTDPCFIPITLDFSKYVDVLEAFKEFKPIQNGCFPPLPPCDITLRSLPISFGNLDDGVAELKLPFSVTLTPDTIFEDGSVGRRRDNIRSGLRSAHLAAGRHIFINTNGKIRFDSKGRFDTRSAQKDLGRENQSSLYVYYSDLVIDGGGLRYAVVGEAPRRELIVQWAGKRQDAPNEPVIFRAIVRESNSEVLYEYDQVPIKRAALIGASVGVQNEGHFLLVQALGIDGKSFMPQSGTALSSHQKSTRKRFVLSPGINEAELHRSQVEISVPLANEGPFSVAFRHHWKNRCATDTKRACTVDQIEVGYRDPADLNKIHTLISSARLTSKVGLDDDFRHQPDEQMSVALPDKLAGKEVKIIFRYTPVKKVPINTKVFWIVDHIQVNGSSISGSTTQNDGEIEEKVWREYDSAESAHTISDPTLLADLTFDVPGWIEDRSSMQAVKRIPLPLNVLTLMGVSGKAITLTNQEVALDLKKTALNGLTTELWIRPEQYPSTARRIVSADGIFSLLLEPDGRVRFGVITTKGPVGGGFSISKLPTDAWTHIALTYDLITVRCLINGAVEGEVSLPGALNPIGRSQIGDGTASDRLSIDEVHIYSTGLSPQRVLQNALRLLLPGPPKGNLIDIRFGNPTSRGLDYSKAGNNANLTGSSRIIPGIQGAALELNGGGLTVPHSPTLVFGDAVTAEVWFKTKNQAVGPIDLISKWSGVGSGWKLSLEPQTGRLRWEVITSISGPHGTSLSHTVFVTVEEVNNDKWHHLAGTYDGQRLRVFIDGIPAHRFCSPVEAGNATQCIDLPPPDICAIEISTLDFRGGSPAGDAVCSEGDIDNTEPVRTGKLPKGSSLNGAVDELRVSNYAKREFEVFASSRTASWYTQLLGQEVDLRNEVPVGTEIAREARTYDLRGRIASLWKNVRGQRSAEGFWVRYASDTLNREGSREYPNGEVTLSRYDHTGLQVGLTGYGTLQSMRTNGRQVYLEAVNSTVSRHIKSQRFGNGVAVSYEYEDGPTRTGSFDSNLASGQVTSRLATVISQRTYTWDKVGNLQSIKDPVQLVQTSYTYDDLSRIKSADFNIPGQSPFTYDYDTLGNINLKEGAVQQYGRSLSAAGCGSGVTTLPHAITRRSKNLTVDTYCYDEAGRLVTSTDTGNNIIKNLSYLARGKLKQLAQKNGDYLYSYDGNGTRVSKVERGEITTEPYAFFREIPKETESLYAANGKLVARRISQQSDGVSWYHLDHLNGTNLMTDWLGNEDSNARSQYLPFGEFLIQPTVNRAGGKQFTGKELDGTGFYDFGNRFYDPVIGRFIEPDSEEPGPSSQGRNRYAYVANNPLRYTDPTGHRPELYDLSSDVRARCSSCTLFFGNDGITAAEIDAMPDLERVALFRSEAWTVPWNYRVDPHKDLWTAYSLGIVMVATNATPAFSGFGALSATARSSVGLGIGARSFAENITPEALLYYEAAQVHTATDSIKMAQRTTSVVRAIDSDGKIVHVFAAGARNDLTPAQRALVADLRGISAKYPGLHAELTALRHIYQNNLKPLSGISYGRDICGTCMITIKKSEGALIDARTFELNWK